MGEVYKPEDLVGEKRKPSDLSPGLGGITPTALQDVIREIRLLKTQVKRIMQVLKANGIVVEENL